MIKDYFLYYADRHADFTVDTLSGTLERHDSPPEIVERDVVDTGLDTMTGGRVRRLRDHLPRTVHADLRRRRRRRRHRPRCWRSTRRTAGSRPSRRSGRRRGSVRWGWTGDSVVDFSEKPQAEGGWINGGFFVFERGSARLPDRRRRRCWSASRSKRWRGTAS